MLDSRLQAMGFEVDKQNPSKFYIKRDGVDIATVHEENNLFLMNILIGNNFAYQCQQQFLTTLGRLDDLDFKVGPRYNMLMPAQYETEIKDTKALLMSTNNFAAVPQSLKGLLDHIIDAGDVSSPKKIFQELMRWVEDCYQRKSNTKDFIMGEFKNKEVIEDYAHIFFSDITQPELRECIPINVGEMEDWINISAKCLDKYLDKNDILLNEKEGMISNLIYSLSLWASANNFFLITKNSFTKKFKLIGNEDSIIGNYFRIATMNPLCLPERKDSIITKEPLAIQDKRYIFFRRNYVEYFKENESKKKYCWPLFLLPEARVELKTWFALPSPQPNWAIEKKLINSEDSIFIKDPCIVYNKDRNDLTKEITSPYLKNDKGKTIKVDYCEMKLSLEYDRHDLLGKADINIHTQKETILNYVLHSKNKKERILSGFNRNPHETGFERYISQNQKIQKVVDKKITRTGTLIMAGIMAIIYSALLYFIFNDYQVSFSIRGATAMIFVAIISSQLHWQGKGNTLNTYVPMMIRSGTLILVIYIPFYCIYAWAKYNGLGSDGFPIILLSLVCYDFLVFLVYWVNDRKKLQRKETNDSYFSNVDAKAKTSLSIVLFFIGLLAIMYLFYYSPTDGLLSIQDHDMAYFVEGIVLFAFFVIKRLMTIESKELKVANQIVSNVYEINKGDKIKDEISTTPESVAPKPTQWALFEQYGGTDIESSNDGSSDTRFRIPYENGWKCFQSTQGAKKFVDEIKDECIEKPAKPKHLFHPETEKELGDALGHWDAGGSEELLNWITQIQGKKEEDNTSIENIIRSLLTNENMMTNYSLLIEKYNGSGAKAKYWIDDDYTKTKKFLHRKDYIIGLRCLCEIKKENTLEIYHSDARYFNSHIFRIYEKMKTVDRMRKTQSLPEIKKEVVIKNVKSEELRYFVYTIHKEDTRSK